MARGWDWPLSGALAYPSGRPSRARVLSSSTGGALYTLDPRDPYVVSIRDLGRRAGAMQQVSLAVPAGVELGSGMARVPEGSDVELDFRLESVVEGVLVSGTARVQVEAECSRCLDPIRWDEEADFQELFAYPPQDARGSRIVEPVDEGQEDPLPVIEDELLDLEPVVRDAVVLRLPMAPLCREDCAGLCSECGARLDDHPGHGHESTDPRWAALSALTRDRSDDPIEEED